MPTKYQTKQEFLEELLTLEDKLNNASEQDVKEIRAEIGRLKSEFGKVKKKEEIQTSREFKTAIKKGVRELKRGENWGPVWNKIHEQFPDMPEARIDKSLGTYWKQNYAQTNWKQKRKNKIKNTLVGITLAGVLSLGGYAGIKNPDMAAEYVPYWYSQREKSIKREELSIEEVVFSEDDIYRHKYYEDLWFGLSNQNVNNEFYDWVIKKYIVITPRDLLCDSRIPVGFTFYDVEKTKLVDGTTYKGKKEILYKEGRYRVYEISNKDSLNVVVHEGRYLDERSFNNGPFDFGFRIKHSQSPAPNSQKMKNANLLIEKVNNHIKSLGYSDDFLF